MKPLVLLVLMAGALAAAQPSDLPPLLAHWTFDEVDGSAVARDTATEQGTDAQSKKPLARIQGIHGRALNLRGPHALATRQGFPPRELGAIAFSAWVRPTGFARYDEIFRQECPARLLFSFQEHGTVLSLGLNIGGYLECDAPIKPEQVLDGAWHHCAATFDGRFMRVYLDGREIGSHERPGKISLQPEPPAYIGSLGGTGEHFQGGLDDLRVYSGALTPEQVAALHRAGAEAAEQLLKEWQARLGQLYPANSSFAQALAVCRQRLVDRPDTSDDLALAIQSKLKKDFPRDLESFREYTRMSVSQYLNSSDPQLGARLAGELVELMLEYRPLTEAQWRKQSDQDRRQWAEADEIQAKYRDLANRGEDSRFSPEWIEVTLAAGARVQFRPSVQEAVAPYVRPATPKLRNYSAEEARGILERDWLHQAGGNPDAERIRQEIQWTRELVERLASNPSAATGWNAEFAELNRMSELAENIKDGHRQLYFRVRDLKRRVMFSNPAVDFDKVLFVDMPFPRGSEWQHETRHRLGYMAVPGGRLLVLDGLRPEGRLTQLMPQAPLHGSFWRPDLSWDATKVLFCFKPHNEKAFHLYEINVDGTGLRQLTDGIYDDLDPIYLPDDRHILFSTTRGHTYVRCMPPTSAFVLARCRHDGSNIYLVSANNEPDYLPTVLNDGRVIYTRWEYTDKPVWRMQKLWTVNPDGSQVSMYWGNQSVWPDLVKDARSIPNSRRVMVTGSAHHNWFAGSIGIVDVDRGLNFPHGLTKVTADTPWPETGNGPVDPVESPRYHGSGHYPAYYSPYPLSEQDFLVSAQRNGKFVLYLMDVDGNRELIYEGAHHIFHAMPLKPKVRPPVVEDRVTWPGGEQREQPAPGVIFSHNVYQNAPPQLHGQARFMRIFTIDHKTYTYWHKRPYLSTGPVVSAVQSEGVKRLLGTVPIEPDGSVAFNAPSGLPLHFQLLDERGRALQTMRSFVNVMPGEHRGCLGCHESHSRAPEGLGTSLAVSRRPHDITPPPWKDQTVSYPRYVQPVLDKYCGKCHQGDGEGRKVLDLTERPGEPIFTEPYLTLIGRPTWGAPYRPPANPPPGFGIAGTLLVEGYAQTDPAAYVTPQPMAALSYRSKLIEIASSGKHQDVRVDDLSLQRLIVWVDAMCPYRGEEEVRELPDPVFQGMEWLAIRPRIATAPSIIRPGPLE